MKYKVINKKTGLEENPANFAINPMGQLLELYPSDYGWGFAKQDDYEIIFEEEKKYSNK